MADNVVDILLRARMDTANVAGEVSAIQRQLQKLTLPKNATEGLEKSFSKLAPLLRDYQKQLNKGINTQKDVQNLNLLKSKIDETFGSITHQIAKINGEQIRLKVDTQSIQKIKAEIEKTQAAITKAQNNIFKPDQTMAGLTSSIKQMQNALNATFSTGKLMFPGLSNIGKQLSQAFNTKDFVAFNNTIDQLKNRIQGLSAGSKRNIAASLGLDVAGKKIETVDKALMKLLNDLSLNKSSINAIDTNTQKLERLRAELQQINTSSLQSGLNAVGNAAGGIERCRNAFQSLSNGARQASIGVMSAKQQVEQLKTTTQYFFGLTNMFYLLRRGINNAVESVRDLDKAMTATAVVTKFDVADMWNMLPEYTKLANELGATTQGAYETMTLYFQQGLDQQQAFELGAETMKMARIAGLDYVQTTNMMTAALRGFNMELNEASAQRINDVYSQLAAKTASDTRELGEAMERTASISHSAGMSFEGTAAFLAQMIETTREAPENLGTAMKTIVARFQELKKNPLEITDVDGEEVSYNRVDTALQSIGVDLKAANGQFRELDQVFLDISKKWDSLSQTQQRYIATMAAGSRQQSRFIAMVGNYKRVLELTGYANNAEGASQKQFEKTLDSFEAKVNKLKNAWQQFTMGIANNKFVKGAVDGITKLLTTTSKLIDTLSLGSGVIKSFLSLTAAFAGLKIGGRIVNSLVGGMAGLVDPTVGLRGGLKGGFFTGAGTPKNSNTALAAQITNPIVAELRAIRNLQSKNLAKNGIVNDARRAALQQHQQYQDFKATREGIIGLGKGTHSVNELTSILGKANQEQQRQLMKSFSSTFRTAAESVLQGHLSKAGTISAESRKGIYSGLTKANSYLRGQVKSGQITAEQYYKSLQDPKVLQQALQAADPSGRHKIASQYLNNLNQQLNEQIRQGYTKGIESSLLAKNAELKARAAAGEKVRVRSDEQMQRILDRVRQPYRDQFLQQESKQNMFANSKWGQGLNAIGAFGSGIASAGMGVQAFAGLLSSSANPALQMFGSALSAVGSTVMAFGMLISGLSAGFNAIAGSTAMMSVASQLPSKLLSILGGPAGASSALTGAFMGLAAVIIGVVAAYKHHIKKIKEAAEEVSNTYSEKSEKANANISTLESYKSDYARLSAGVDKNGLNVSLDSADYSHYLEIVDKIAEINPDIVEGYNSQGHAIITNNKALEKTLDLENKRLKGIVDTYTTEESLQKLKAARDLEATTKTVVEREGKSGGTRGRRASRADTLWGEKEFRPQKNMRSQAQKIGKLWKEGFQAGWAEGDFGSFGIDINKLIAGNEEAVQAFNQRYDQITSHISSQMEAGGKKVSDSTKESFAEMTTAYTDASEQLDELITPMYEQLAVKMSQSSLFKDIPKEAATYFNQGLKEIAADANVEDVTKEANKLAKQFSVLTDENSDYTEVITKAEEAQKKYADTLDRTEYNKAAREAEDGINRIRQALEDSGTDLNVGYGKALDEFLNNELEKIKHFADEGSISLSEALNTMANEIAAAEGVLENFKTVAEGSNFSTAADNFKELYDTMTDEKHQAALGDQTYWAGAEAIFGRENLKGKAKEEIDGMLKTVDKELQGGQAGFDAFWQHWVDKKDELEKITGLDLYDDTGWLETMDDTINPDILSEVANTLGRSEEYVTAMLNAGRQFAGVDFSNVEQVRQALATSDTIIKGMSSTNGKRNLYVKEESFNAELSAAGITSIDQQERIKSKMADEQNIKMITEASKIGIKELQDMGVTSQQSLIKIFDETGQFNKDEIQEYAKAYAEKSGETFKESDFTKDYNEYVDSLTDPNSAKQLQSLLTIQDSVSQIAESVRNEGLKEGRLDNPTADTTWDMLVGGKGVDTEAQQFYYGKNARGEELSKTEFEDTSAKLKQLKEDSAAYVKQLEEAQKVAKENGDKTELEKIQNEIDAYNNKIIPKIDEQLQHGTEAYNNGIQEKINTINQGFNQLLGSITPESINTDEAQNALTKLYDAAISGDPTTLTDGLKSQLETLGINIQEAVNQGLVIDPSGAYKAAEEIGEEEAEAHHKGWYRGQQQGKNDTSDAEKAGKQAAEEQNKAYSGGMGKGPTGRGKTTSQSTTPTTTAERAQEFVNQNQQVNYVEHVDYSEATQAKKETEDLTKTVEKGGTYQINVSGAQSIKAAKEEAKSSKGGSKQQSTPTVKSQVMNVTANTAAAQSKINALIAKFNKTYTLKYKASGPTSIKVPISANFTGPWEKKVKITKSEAKGINNYIAHRTLPAFGSLARGRYGRLGPKGRGGLTLTGEKGFEIAWLPSESRSMILGTQGPQMVNLPSDAVVYTHEQSKDILKKRQTINAGSHYAYSPNYTPGNNNSSSSSSTARTVSHAAKRVTKAAEDTAKNLGYVSVWWENIARKTEISQRRMDSALKSFEKFTKEMSATLRKTGQSLASGGGGGDNYIKNISDYIGYNQAQINKANAELTQLNKGTKAQQQGKKGANNAAYNSGAASTVKISYSYKTGKKKKKSKSKEEIVNLAPYIKEENGTYVVDQKKINSIKNVEKRRAIADAANKEINDRLSKKYTAEDNIQKAQEALEKMGEELYKTFFAWENELTKIWNLTKQIENTEDGISRIKEYQETLNKQLATGFAKATEGFNAKTFDAFQAGLDESVSKIRSQVQLIDEQRTAVQKAFSVADERAILTSIQNKLNAAASAADAVAKAQDTKEEAETKLANAKTKKSNAQATKKDAEAQIKSLEKQKKKAKSKEKKKKIQAKINKQVERKNKAINTLKTIDSTISTYDAQVKSATDAYNSALAAASKQLNDTEKLGYETYVKNLQDQIAAQAAAQKYLSVTQNADGTVEVSFNTTAFENDKLKGLFTEDRAKAIQDYVKNIVDASKELNDAYKDTRSSINELYDNLSTLQDAWADYANELWQISDEEIKKETQNAKKISDSITNALKKLLDEVKRKLDERRKQEDNAKTERDISQKQQRLAALRADTSGGHQVEIAQLEKEIAEAQQNYQRSLEDQLLDKLQQQADLAAEQRERQIEIQESIAEGVNNALLVDKWMDDPETYRNEIYEAFKTANEYDKKPEALQEQLDTKFETLMNGLANNQKEQESLSNAITSLNDVLELLEESIANMQTVTGTKSIEQLRDNGYTYAEIKGAGFTAADFKAANVSYNDAKNAGFNDDQLRAAGYSIPAPTTTNTNTNTNTNTSTPTSTSTTTPNASAANAAKNNYTNYLKSVKKLSPKKVTKAHVNKLFNLGAAAGYGKASVLKHLVDKDKLTNLDPFTWKNIFKAIIDADGINRYNLVRTWPNGDGSLAKALKTLGNPDTLSEIKKHKNYKSAKALKFKTGGLASYTGPAWLDGTPSKPELVLNAQDTKNFIALKDILSNAMDSAGATTNSYGDATFEININVDHIDNDYDVDRMVDRVKKEIVKSAGYRNVTQVRNFK